jgi:hypothetical protein
MVGPCGGSYHLTEAQRLGMVMAPRAEIAYGAIDEVDTVYTAALSVVLAPELIAQKH